MRVLRGLGGWRLPCGCLAGIYETYGGEVVHTIDAREPTCTDPGHRLHAAVAAPDQPAELSRSGRSGAVS